MSVVDRIILLKKILNNILHYIIIKVYNYGKDGLIFNNFNNIFVITVILKFSDIFIL